jgi:hypothetical protein
LQENSAYAPSPFESLIRQYRKNLVYIGVRLADPQLLGDFPYEDRTDEDVVVRIADKAPHGCPASPRRSNVSRRASRLVFHRGQEIRRQALEVFGSFDLPAQRAGFANDCVL